MAMKLTGELLVGDSWRRGGGAPFASHAPADGAEVWSGREASSADVDAAVQAARTGFHAWRRTPLAERIGLVRRFAEALKARKDDLAALICRETGKVSWDAAGEVAAMIGKADLSVRAHEERTGTRDQPAGAFIARVTHRPHGVMAVLGPFNFPGHLPNGHIMPALIAGNSIVFKPSEKAPATAEWTVRLWRETGAPPGVLNLLQGGREPAGALVANAGVDGVLFTGGAAAGTAIHRAMSGEPHRILALELGGNNPLVVWDADDVDAAARLVLKSAYISSGQRCTCARRLVIAQGAAGDRVVDAVLGLLERVMVGAPDADPQPFMGPLISEAAADAVLAAEAEMVAGGARSLKPLARLPAGGAFLSPGLIDVTGQSGRRDEEVFGPLLQVVRVRDFDAALDEANATRFGLAAGLISDDAALFERFCSEIRAGVVNWNRQTTGASGAAPFGGVGRSGNHRPAGYAAADYCAWPMAMLLAEGPVSDDERIIGLAP
ncbi:succinylglutamate-semialdehyde dehydrogenase [bacterium]|nr:succinylglutamate-semialdehyde dehydrogenase [bacterium]